MNPYSKAPPKAFWKTAIADLDLFEISEVWRPRHPITRDTSIVTYGSCFAQHFSRALLRNGYGWRNHEPAPEGMHETTATAFNYGVFSSRTANIYTTGILRQWMDWATGDREQPDECWIRGDRFIDPFRPRIEPEGFETVEEMRRSRDVAIKAFRRSVLQCDVFVFTLGLTECWRNVSQGIEYPMCPGTVAGTFDPEKHTFFNLGHAEILQDARRVIGHLEAHNPGVKVLLTVSPVPLTATGSGDHVLVATVRSKAVLRAVADALYQEFECVDYFPSFELVTSPKARSMFFEANMRSVTQAGVEFVMNTFFRSMAETFGSESEQPAVEEVEDDVDVFCEEEYLEESIGN